MKTKVKSLFPRKTNAAKTAKLLVEDGFPIEQYLQIQARRRERLALWTERKINVLIATEKEIVAHGDKVLKHMEKLLAKQK